MASGGAPVRPMRKVTITIEYMKFFPEGFYNVFPNLSAAPLAARVPPNATPKVKRRKKVPNIEAMPLTKVEKKLELKPSMATNDTSAVEIRAQKIGLIPFTARNTTMLLLQSIRWLG